MVFQRAHGIRTVFRLEITSDEHQFCTSQFCQYLPIHFQNISTDQNTGVHSLDQKNRFFSKLKKRKITAF